MNHKWIQVLGLAIIAVVLVTGCGKKPPVIPEPMEAAPVETTPTEVIPPPPAPPVVEDDTPDWESGPLAELQQYAVDNGLLGDVYFDYDKSDLSTEATDRLAANAAFMNSQPNLRFSVEGHCDERGTNGYNLALGDDRANAAGSYLGSLGVDGGRLSPVSHGEERPQCNDSAESCWQRNRRAHFVITGQ